VNADLVPVPSQLLERLSAVGVDVARVLQLDVASLAALHAPNLGEALKKLARYKRLVCPEEIGIEIVDGEARIRFEWTLAEEQVPLLIVDGAFATVVAIARRGTGRPMVPRRVELARRLEAAGTTYQELLDEVRRQSARRLLANTNLDAGEVAFLLGFEELNSFTRAFHAWEGTTPTRWRESDNIRT